MRALKDALEAGTADLRTADGYENDIHAVAGLIKVPWSGDGGCECFPEPPAPVLMLCLVSQAYFRDLPEPVLTYRLCNDWVAASSITDHDNKLYVIEEPAC